MEDSGTPVSTGTSNSRENSDQLNKITPKMAI